MDEDFAEFAHAQTAQLFRTAVLLTGNPDDAWDLTQEVFVRMAGRWTSIDSSGNPGGYAHRCLVNLNISRLRRLRRFVAPDADALGAARSTDPESSVQVIAALRTLPPRQRTAVVLRFYSDMSFEQIADSMGCSVGTAKSQVSRALDKLRVSPLMCQDEALKEKT